MVRRTSSRSSTALANPHAEREANDLGDPIVRPFVFTLLVALILAIPVPAGIYSPSEPFLFEIDADGFAKPIQFSGGFDSIRAGVREAGIRPLLSTDPVTPARAEALQRVKQREAKGIANLSNDELAALTTDLIRL